MLTFNRVTCEIFFDKFGRQEISKKFLKNLFSSVDVALGACWLDSASDALISISESTKMF